MRLRTDTAPAKGDQVASPTPEPRRSHIGGIVAGELLGRTRVCVYDRAGRGCSDPAPSPPDGDQIATDLHRLLAHAQVAAGSYDAATAATAEEMRGVLDEYGQETRSAAEAGRLQNLDAKPLIVPTGANGEPL